MSFLNRQDRLRLDRYTFQGVDDHSSKPDKPSTKPDKGFCWSVSENRMSVFLEPTYVTRTRIRAAEKYESLFIADRGADDHASEQDET